MPLSSQDISASIIGFLKNSLDKEEVPEDNRESIEFAVESIADAFNVDIDSIAATIKTKFDNKQLPELLNAFLASAKLTEHESKPKKQSQEAVPIHIDQEDAEKKELADSLKLEGNRAMNRKDFEEAIQKYTEAIDLIPNAVYYSNRAAAHSSVRKHELALRDAEKAIEVEPTYAKAWSRLGLAKYALGDAEGAMEAYEQGLKVEDDKPSEAMKNGYETAKKRVAEKISDSLKASAESDAQSTSGIAGAGAGAGDVGAARGAGGLGGLGGLAGLMNNPQLMQAAQQMMQNPDALSGLLNNSQLKDMVQSLALGGEGANSLDDLMGNPMLQNLAKSFIGGNNGGSS